MSKKILILTPFYPPNIGGAETFAEGLCNEAKKWFNVTVLTFQPFQGRAKAYEEFYYPKGSLKIHRMRWLLNQGAWKGISLKNFITVMPQMFFWSFVLLSKRKYDIIHAQGLISGLVAVLLKKVFKVKVFLTLLALYDFKRGVISSVARYIFKNCDLLFVEGANGSDNIRWMVDERKVRIFNHWVDQTIFKPMPRMNDKIRVLFVGRPIPEKGRHIIEGAERLLNNKDKYEFTYLEDVSYKDLPAYYQRSHVVCVSSLYPEGYCRVVAEASSCGCSVVVSNRGSLREMCTDFGYIAEPRVKDFKEAIEEVSQNLKEHQDRCYQYALQNFNRSNADVFIGVYYDY
jgi:glycosyltransferase involved in cell wall biosynthesis